jgi:hypothetical protein
MEKQEDTRLHHRTFVLVPQEALVVPPVFTESILLEKIREEVEQFPSVKGFADAHGVSAEYTRQVIRGIRPPSTNLLDALGYQRVTLYRKKDASAPPIVSSFDGDGGVETEIKDGDGDAQP